MGNAMYTHHNRISAVKAAVALSGDTAAQGELMGNTFLMDVQSLERTKFENKQLKKNMNQFRI